MSFYKNKVVVITGSTQGIGKRTAELMCQQGAKVVINSRSQEKVGVVVNEFKEKGYSVLGVAGDVSSPNFCDELRSTTLKSFDKIDILINNAGLASKGSLSDTKAEVFKMMFEVNVLGSLNPTISMLEELKKTKGSVLFISSMAGIIGLPSYGAYSGTKRSIVSLAESFRAELVDDNVFVGINYPGFTENDPNKQTITSDGTPETMVKRDDVKVEPLDKTVGKIMRQIERKKFRSFTSYKGRALLTMYRLFPTLSLAILKKNRRKIMDMQ